MDTKRCKGTGKLWFDLRRLRLLNHIQHDRIEVRARQPLRLFRDLCKGVQDEWNKRENLIKKEHGKKATLDKTFGKDAGNKMKIVGLLYQTGLMSA